jgi:hypothetical protein
VPSGVDAADILGHLHHHVELESPQELRMVVCDMALGRFEQLQARVACELRPALADGDLAMPVDDDVPRVIASVLHVLRPAEDVGVSDPGLH